MILNRAIGYFVLGLALMGGYDGYCGNTGSESRSWPELVSQSVEATARSLSEVELHYTVRSKRSDPLYELSCLGSAKFPKNDNSASWTGDLMCRLRSLYSRDSESNLLQDDPNATREWQTRSRFFEKELVGDCASEPEIGSQRTFRLRGVRVELDVLLKPTGAVVRAAIEPDPLAISRIAEPILIAEEVAERCARFSEQVLDVIPASPSIARLPRARSLRYVFDSTRPPKNSVLVAESFTDTLGQPLFGLRCEAYLAVAHDRDVIARRGIDCDLTEPGKAADFLSLTRDSVTGADRSIFDPEQLEAPHISYPDWGGKRVFLFRNTRLSLEISRVHFCPECPVPRDLASSAIDHLELAIEIAPDPAALSPIPLPASSGDWRAALPP